MSCGDLLVFLHDVIEFVGVVVDLIRIVAQRVMFALIFVDLRLDVHHFVVEGLVVVNQFEKTGVSGHRMAKHLDFVSVHRVSTKV